MKSRSFSPAEMETRIARFAGMAPNKVAFLDTRLPDHHRDVFNMIDPRQPTARQAIRISAYRRARTNGESARPP